MACALQFLLARKHDAVVQQPLLPKMHSIFPMCGTYSLNLRLQATWMISMGLSHAEPCLRLLQDYDSWYYC
jgi:hypothetical protein